MIFFSISERFSVMIYIFFIYIGIISAQNNGNVTQIINLKSFILNSLYDKDIRPPVFLPALGESYTVPMRVKIDFELVNFFGIDEVSGIFQTYGVLTAIWEDMRLKWDPNQYGGSSEILLHESVVWKPKITVGNPSNKFKTFGHDENFILFNMDGMASWRVGDVIDSSCDINANYFPFDKQKCEILLYSWGYHTSAVVFSPDSSVNLDSLAPNGVWNVYETQVLVQTKAGISYVILTFKLERRSTYFIVNAFVPVFILGLLNTMVFVLPADSGERVGYSVTCLLAIAVLLTIINDNLPKASDPIPIISFFMMLDLGVSALMTLITVLNLRNHIADEKSKVPMLVQRCLRFLRCKSCKTRSKCCTKPHCCVRTNTDSTITIVKESTTPVKEEKNLSSESTKKKIFHSIAVDVMQNTPPSSAESRNDKKLKKKLESESSKSEPEVETEDTDEITWKDIGRIIDVLSFILGNSLTVILVLVYLSVSNTSNVI